MSNKKHKAMMPFFTRCNIILFFLLIISPSDAKWSLKLTCLYNTIGKRDKNDPLKSHLAICINNKSLQCSKPLPVIRFLKI